MKYFEKQAAGPHVVYDTIPKEFGNLRGGYLSDKYIKYVPKKWQESTKKKKGLVMISKPIHDQLINKYESDLIIQGLPKPVIEKETKRYGNKIIQNTKRHELVHHLRAQKGKWSSIETGKNPIKRIVEETAAHGRVAGNKWKGFKEATELHAPKIYKIIKKLI
ncbi:hypothetical protein AYK24_00200 [Thermoplasmatales archaeon SG8-52-4]|nr:MAG: hypothetical protein AYK24_00200 [Thermoplasmatales archaeon SG8-52-4]